MTTTYAEIRQGRRADAMGALVAHEVRASVAKRRTKADLQAALTESEHHIFALKEREATAKAAERRLEQLAQYIADGSFDRWRAGASGDTVARVMHVLHAAAVEVSALRDRSPTQTSDRAAADANARAATAETLRANAEAEAQTAKAQLQIALETTKMLASNLGGIR